MTDSKIDSTTDSETQSRWKNRYYEALEDLEAKEKSWREIERLLRQLVSRLTLAADTRHEILTSQLKELRNAVRDGRDFLQLRELIEKISENVAELDRLRKKANSQVHPAEIFIDIFEQITIPSQLTRSFRQLKKKAKKLDKHSPADSMNDELTEFVKEIVNPPLIEKQQTRKAKILDRLLSRTTKEGVDKQNTDTDLQAGQPSVANEEIKPVPQKFVAPAVGDLLLQLSLRLPDVVKRRINFPALKKYTNRARSRKDLISIVDVIAQQIEAAYANEESTAVVLDDESVKALSEAIRQFFTQLQPPTDLHERVCGLEEYFSDHSDDVESIVHCINSLAEIVADICSRLSAQHDELEGFFIHLSTRLQDIDSGLNKAAEFNALGGDNCQEMDRAVQNEMDGINESIMTIEDIEPLKESIKQRVDGIAEHLQKFQEVESARLRESEEHIRKLTEKIAKMEVDSDHLRSHMEETEQQAFKDYLTGIPNRNAYEVRLAEEVARCKRYNGELCMVVWDVDNFKHINDNYGHAAGDRVLKVIAETLGTSIRETDFLARFGGEEFILLLPGTSMDAAYQVAEKLRTTIESTPFHFRDSGVLVTISGGISQFLEEDSANTLFERADKALYQAKANGRNRVALAE
ncbi:MAG: GGDEF domain-containing protein [Thioalkalispiraceae bacterium]|jgi:diguanylate cyclase